jgi:hypothetical protein
VEQWGDYVLEDPVGVDNVEIADSVAAVTAALLSLRIVLVVEDAAGTVAVAQELNIRLRQAEMFDWVVAVEEFLEADNIPAVAERSDLVARLSQEQEVFQRIVAVVGQRIDCVGRPRPLQLVREEVSYYFVSSTAGVVRLQGIYRD